MIENFIIFAKLVKFVVPKTWRVWVRGSVGWVGLGPDFKIFRGLGWVGSVSWWVGLGRKNGPTDNSDSDRPSTIQLPLMMLMISFPLLFN